jgi:hypothetical protein
LILLSEKELSMKFLRFLPLLLATVSTIALPAQEGSSPFTPLRLEQDGDLRVIRFYAVAEGAPALPIASIPVPPDMSALQENDEITLRNEDYRLSILPEADSPFFLITVEPFSREGRTPLEKIVVPAISLNNPEKPRELRTFGSGGLKPADEPSGSYAFLGVVHPGSNAGCLAGWLSSRYGSGIFFSAAEEDGNVSLTPQIDYGAWRVPSEGDFGEVMVFGAFADLRDGLEAYGKALAARNHVQIKPAPCGYCTWYSNKHRGCGDEESTAEFAQVAAEKLVPYGMNFFQIDDGWQLGASNNGPNKNFTAHNHDGPYRSGIKATADRLHSLGLKTGLWFMPFSGNFDDPWFADKQDFFVRSAIDYPLAGEKNTRRFPNINQKKGAPYETFWGGTALDMTFPKTQAYVRDMVRRIAREWGCDYFKIDGMWNGAAVEQLYVNDEYLPDDIGNQIFADPSASNIEAYRTGLSLVREAAGDDVFILGCNISQNMRTMNASIGYVDAMRIGPDNGPSWEGIRLGPWRATNRYFYNGRVWWNDPDPVYVRDEIPLKHAQAITSWAAISGQLYAFSDWLPDLSAERVNVLRRTMPNHGKTSVRPVDLFTSDLARVWVLTDPAVENLRPKRAVVGIFNWNGSDAESFRLTAEALGIENAEEYAIHDFWQDRFVASGGANTPLDVTIPAASCLVAAVRPIFDERPVLLSTSRHVTQGILEVEKEIWDSETGTLTVEIDPVKGALAEELRYRLSLWRRAPCEEVSVDLSTGGKVQIESEPAGSGTLYRVTLPRLTKKESEQGLVQAKIRFHGSRP